jgi:hypothetical protein
MGKDIEKVEQTLHPDEEMATIQMTSPVRQNGACHFMLMGRTNVVLIHKPT